MPTTTFDEVEVSSDGRFAGFQVLPFPADGSVHIADLAVESDDLSVFLSVDLENRVVYVNVNH